MKCTNLAKLVERKLMGLSMFLYLLKCFTAMVMMYIFLINH